MVDFPDSPAPEVDTSEVSQSVTRHRCRHRLRYVSLTEQQQLDLLRLLLLIFLDGPIQILARHRFRRGRLF